MKCKREKSLFRTLLHTPAVNFAYIWQASKPHLAVATHTMHCWLQHSGPPFAAAKTSLLFSGLVNFYCNLVQNKFAPCIRQWNSLTKKGYLNENNIKKYIFGNKNIAFAKTLHIKFSTFSPGRAKTSCMLFYKHTQCNAPLNGIFH